MFCSRLYSFCFKFYPMVGYDVVSAICMSMIWPVYRLRVSANATDIRRFVSTSRPTVAIKAVFTKPIRQH